MTSKLHEDLKESIEGHVHFDSLTKKIYSVDASIFEMEPVGIIIPKNRQDIIAAVKIAKKHNVPIIPRGAATGITGGCIGKGLIIDTSTHLQNILEINYDEEYAICEPGVVQDRLNEALDSRGYRLGPDTSTGNRATLGGMVANNSAGGRSLRYGKMVDHVEAVEIILASGEACEFSAGTKNPLVDEVTRIRDSYRTEIEKRFPKIPRRVSGYNLDELIKPEPLNLAKLIVGSEGTLGIITKIKVKISKKPLLTGQCLLFFEDMIAGMKQVPEILTHSPLSLEMIDDKIINLGRESPTMRGKLDWLPQDSKLIFVVEFDAPTLDALQEKLRRLESKNTLSLTDPATLQNVRSLRKAGLGLLMSKRSYNNAIAFLEDISVSPEQLAPFMEKFRSYLQEKGKDAGIYGHAGSGCMHIRPYLDLRQPEEIALIKQMMLDISTLLLEHGGALSGEHGDGFIRSWLNKKMFGDKLYQAFVEVKNAFDPERRMNPGKIVEATFPQEELRITPQTKTVPLETFLDFSKEGGFPLAVDMCNGNGLCRKMENTMCPSFQATQEEFHGTRARAQSLRAFIHGKLPTQKMDSHALYEVLDLCLSCKGCKTECPSQVDMAKMKAEFLHHYYKSHGAKWRDKLFAHIGDLYSIGSISPTLFNFFSKKTAVFLEITSDRPLPALASERFTSWFRNYSQPNSNKSVVLFSDTFTEFTQPQIGKAAVKVLTTLGYHVIVPDWHCCGRPMISKGFLPQARKKAQKLIETLLPYAVQNIPIVGLEPSCLLTIKDDYPDLAKHPNMSQLIRACTTFDEFLSTHTLPLKALSPQEVLVHGHCHQKSLVGMQPTLDVLHAISGITPREIPSGCCGMAGSFGYEKEHADISKQIGELKLLPAVRAASPGSPIIASGTSCRSQIADFTPKEAIHLAEFIASLL